jgi:formylglycine-generating enzyme required for sulfatase activity
LENGFLKMKIKISKKLYNFYGRACILFFISVLSIFLSINCNNKYGHPYQVALGQSLAPEAVTRENMAPTIKTFTSNPLAVKYETTSNLTVEAEDGNNDPLTYKYEITSGGGSVIQDGSGAARFVAPNEWGTTTIKVTVSDPDEASASQTLDINAIPVALPEMVLVEGGSFTMGHNSIANANVTHQVNLSSYKMSKFEITYELWYEVKNWGEAHGYTFANIGRAGDDGISGALGADKMEPVTEITWFDCVAWCNALSEMAGLNPSYYNHGSSHVYPDVYRNSGNSTHLQNSDVKWDADGFRLATEAQWEFAARSRGAAPGDQHAGYNVDTNIANCSWYKDGTTSHTHPVGQKTANSLGIHDMSGNVWEWCWDWFDTYTNTSPYTDKDSKGPETSPMDRRVRRGGSYSNEAEYSQTSLRDASNPNNSGISQGFRVVLPLSE